VILIGATTRRDGERGFALLFIFVLAAGIAIGLLMQLPRVAFETQRNREEMLIERGEQYQRAIGLYLKTVKRYPAKIEDLENTNNVRFLRRRYIDPMTGKDEWRLVHVGPSGQLTDSLVQKPPAQTKDGKSGDPMNADPSNTVGVEQGPQEVNEAVKARPSDMVGGMPVGAPPPPSQPGTTQDAEAYPPPPQPGVYPQPGHPAVYPQPPPGQPGYPVQGQPPAPGVHPQPGQVGPNQMYPPPGAPGQTQQPGPLIYAPGYPQPGQPGSVPTQPSPVTSPPGYPQPGQPGSLPGQPGQVAYPPGYPQPGQPGNAQPVQVTYPPGYPQPGQPAYPGQPGVPQPGQQAPQQPYSPMQAMPGVVAPQQGQMNAPGLPQYLQPGNNQNQQQAPQTGAPGSGPQQMTATQLIGQILTSGRNAPPSAFNSQSYGAGIAGVASTYKGPSIKIYNDRQKYQEWEFVYDPKKDKALMQGMPAAGAPNPNARPGDSSSSSFSSGASSSPGPGLAGAPPQRNR
jgi:hypothetical protein